jgi:hypothetical protein
MVTGSLEAANGRATRAFTAAGHHGASINLPDSSSRDPALGQMEAIITQVG